MNAPTTEPRAARGAAAWAPIILVVAALVVFWPVLFGGRTMYPTDITNRLFLPFAANATDHTAQATSLTDYVMFYYPARVFQMHSLRAGELGLWNPDIFGGHPAFASSGGVAMLDPFNLLFLPMSDLGTALAWRSCLQVLACMLFMYAYLRHLALGRAASLTGSLAFGLNSMYWANVFDWSVSGMLWLPLICLLLDRALARLSLSDTALAGLALGVALLASPLQVGFYVGFTACALAVLRWLVWPMERRHTRARAAVLLVAVFVGLGVAAVQWVMTLELIQQSTRLAAGASNVSAKHIRTLREAVFASGGLLSFLFPNLAGRIAGSLMISGGLWGGETHWQGFFGVLPFVLALVGVVGLRDRLRLPYIALAIGAVITVVYTPLMLLVYERFLLVYIFSACVLAAIGADALVRSRADLRRMQAVLKWCTSLGVAVLALHAAVTAALLVWGDRIHERIHAAVLPTLRDNYLGQAYPALYLAKADQFLSDLTLANPQTLVPLAFFSAALTLLWRRPRLSARIVAACCVLLTAADLLFMTWTHVPLVNRSTDPFVPAAASIDELRRSTSARVMSVPAPEGPPVLPSDTMEAFGLSSASGYDNLRPPDLADLVKVSWRICGDEMCADPHGSAVANVGYLVTDQHVRLPTPRFVLDYDGEVRIYRDTATLPRAFWTANWRVEPNREAAVEFARSVDPLTDPVVTIDRHPNVEPDPRQRRVEAVITRTGQTRVEVRVDAPAAGVLVFSDTYYPGWLADVDGVRTDVLRVNGVAKGVVVDAGAHRVVFTYAPRRFTVAAWVSGVTAVGALGVWCAGLITRRRHGNAEGRRSSLVAREVQT
jgi:hypothetical protein